MTEKTPVVEAVVTDVPSKMSLLKQAMTKKVVLTSLAAGVAIGLVVVAVSNARSEETENTDETPDVTVK